MTRRASPLFHEIIKTTERELIAWAMRKTKGNKTQAARFALYEAFNLS